MSYPRRLALTNPSFETGASAPGDGWTVVSGTPAFRTSSPPPDLRSGTRYLMVGANPTASVRQDIALPADTHADIDAGMLGATMRFLWANFAAGNDPGWVEMAFLDAGGALIGTVNSGNFPDSVLFWSAKAFTAAVPPGTRTLRLTLGGTRTSGVNLDSYFDLVRAELVLADPPAGDVLQVYAELIRSLADKPATAAGGPIVCVITA